MALSYKARRRWSLFILLVGLPVYVVIVANLMTFIGRLPLALELLAYIVLGVVWVLPFKFVFLGVGQADPNAKADDS
jgi:hypothetical protein